MTNREAIRRLAVNSDDCLAIEWLHHNNLEVIHAVVARYFGVGPLAEKAEHMLMQRVAGRARSCERGGKLDEWLEKCVNAECDRLRNEAIHKGATSD